MILDHSEVVRMMNPQLPQVEFQTMSPFSMHLRVATLYNQNGI